MSIALDPQPITTFHLAKRGCLLLIFTLLGGCDHQLDLDWEGVCQPEYSDPAGGVWIIDEENESIAGQWRLEIDFYVHYCATPYLGEEILSAPLVFDTYDGKIWWVQSSRVDPRSPLNRDISVGKWLTDTPLIIDLPLNRTQSDPDPARLMNLVVREVSSSQEIQGEARIYVRAADPDDRSTLTLAHQGSFTLTRL